MAEIENELIEAAKNTARELSDILDQLDETEYDDELNQVLHDLEYRLS